MEAQPPQQQKLGQDSAELAAAWMRTNAFGGNRIDRLGIPQAVACVVLGFLLASLPGRASVFYKFDVVAQSQPGGTPDVPTDFDQEVSINDAGRVAFIGNVPGRSSSISRLYIGDGYGNPPRCVYTNLLPDFRISHPQIINDGTILAKETVDGSPPTFYLRTWNSDDPRAVNTLLHVDGGDSLVWPSISNDRYVSYVEVDNFPSFNVLKLYSAGAIYPLSQASGY